MCKEDHRLSDSSRQSATSTRQRPLILITNDDGYHSEGIRHLVAFVKTMGDVVVVAPESARSGYSCAFSVS